MPPLCSVIICHGSRSLSEKRKNDWSYFLIWARIYHMSRHAILRLKGPLNPFYSLQPPPPHSASSSSSPSLHFPFTALVFKNNLDHTAKQQQNHGCRGNSHTLTWPYIRGVLLCSWQGLNSHILKKEKDHLGTYSITIVVLLVVKCLAR